MVLMAKLMNQAMRSRKMRHDLPRFMALSVLALLLLFTGLTYADSTLPDSGAPVRFNGETLFTIHTGLADITPATRAEAIEKRLDRLARSAPSTLSSLKIEDREQTSYVVTSEEVLFVVTETEAEAAGKPRHLLAEEQTEQIRKALSQAVSSAREPAPKPTAPIVLRY
jgi:hypothetical protein